MSTLNIKTGDIILTSNNAPGGIVIRITTSGIWNHVGIAIRVLPNGKISLTSEGTLCVLELLILARKDHILQKDITGVGLSEWDFVTKKFARVAHRPIKDEFRVPKLALNVERFLAKYRNKNPHKALDVLDFLGIGIGLPLGNKDENDHRYFCSEIAALFIDECLGPIVAQKRSLSYKQDFRFLLGPQAPHMAELFNADNFISQHTSDTLFAGPEQIIQQRTASIWKIIWLPLLIVLFLVFVIFIIGWLLQKC